MGRRPFFQNTWPTGTWKNFNIINHKRIANQNHNEIFSHQPEWLSPKTQITNAGKDVENKEPLCNPLVGM